jgi:DnaJ-domain-containing protein 1
MVVVKGRDNWMMPTSPLLLPPPGESRSFQSNNAFAVLGVSPDATPREVKRAYLYLARKYHPDVNHSADAREIFLAVNRAYADIQIRRDLTELMLKCKVVKAKAEYAEGLQLFKRAKLFAGIEPQVAGGAATGELGKQLQTLGMYLFFVCPGCRLAWKE